MIRGIHAMFYTPEAEAARAFIRDKLGFAHTDVGGGWLIFDVKEGEIGCHPADDARHDISFYCDDIEATVAQLTAKGVVFKGPVVDQGFGLVTSFEIPGGVEALLYQPKYTKDKG